MDENGDVEFLLNLWHGIYVTQKKKKQENARAMSHLFKIQDFARPAWHNESFKKRDQVIYSSVDVYCKFLISTILVLFFPTAFRPSAHNGSARELARLSILLWFYIHFEWKSCRNHWNGNIHSTHRERQIAWQQQQQPWAKKWNKIKYSKFYYSKMPNDDVEYTKQWSNGKLGETTE